MIHNKLNYEDKLRVGDMALGEFFEFISELSLFAARSPDTKRKRNRIGAFIFAILLLVGVVLNLANISYLTTLISPAYFVALSSFLGFILFIVNVILTYKIGLFDNYTSRIYGMIFFVSILISLPLCSFLNQQFPLNNSSYSVTVLERPQLSQGIRQLKIDYKGGKRVNVDPEFINIIKKGDSINLSITTGLLGFDYVSAYSKPLN